MDFYALQDSLKGPRRGVMSDSNSIDNKYTLLEKIGKGAYGVVWKAKRINNTSDETYAVKHVNKRHAGAKGLKEVMGEVETMSLLSHPNIVKLEETFHDDSSLWIVMEYLPGGELQQLLKGQKLSESTVRRIVTQLLMAIEYIHDKGIVHRDLKPANCLLATPDTNVKISDFGFAVLAGTDQCLSTYCGTIAFMAPEILMERNYGKPVDMWALGVMTYLMIVGEYPFVGDTAASLTRAICNNTIIFDNVRLCQFPLLRDFISKVLFTDPNRRMTAREALKHPWIKSGIDNSGMSELSPPKNQTVEVPPIGKLRAAGVAVLATQRLRYLQRRRRLIKMGYGGIPVLCDYHYLVTGVYCPETSFLDCSEQFKEKPQALEELFVMIETCKYIRHVDISGNNIDNLALVQSFLKLVNKHPSVTSINLSNNPIPSLAGRGLVRLARNPMSHVRKINVEGTYIGEETVTQIHSILKERAATQSFCSTPLIDPPDSNNNSHCSHAPANQRSSDSFPTAMSTRSVNTSRLSASSSICSNTHTQRKRGVHLTRLPPLPQAALNRRGDHK